MLKAAGEAGFSVLPAGTYDVVVDTASSKKTSSDKDSIALQFKVENGPNAGQNAFTQMVISPENANALAFWFRHMAAMGLTENYFQSNPALERVAADLIGRRCRIKVSIRQWQEQDRNQVDSILPPIGNAQAPAMPGTSPAPPVPSSAVPGPPVPHVPTPPAPVVPSAPTVIPPPPGDDDLPF